MYNSKIPDPDQELNFVLTTVETKSQLDLLKLQRLVKRSRNKSILRMIHYS